MTQNLVRNTLTATASTSGREHAAVRGGRIIDWDAYEAILDEVLYSKVTSVSRRLINLDLTCKKIVRRLLHWYISLACI